MWGSQNWGTMIWGGAAVPLSSPLGLVLLALLLMLAGAWLRRRGTPRALLAGLLACALVLPLVAIAGGLTVPNTFSNGTVADADEVNANFAVVETEVSDNDARIAALEAASSSVLYTRWGRNDCPVDTTLVYGGVMGGANFSQTGSGSNALCMPLDPQWNGFDDGSQDGALLYGAEYEMAGFGLSGVAPFNQLSQLEVPCAVCLREGAGVVLQQPARRDCPAGFGLEYEGYLMASQYQQAKSEFLCVDANAIGVGSTSNVNGALLYPTEAECGALPCGGGQYVQNRELTCSVCSR